MREIEHPTRAGDSLMWTAEPRALWRRWRFSVGVPVLLSFAATIFAFFFANSTEEDRTRLEFERRADVLALSLQKGLGSYIDILHAVERFFVNSRDVGPKEFRSFTQLPYRRHPGIQALEWVPRVSDSRRKEFEDAARRNGNESFQFTELEKQGQMTRAGKRDEYFPVYYVEPYEGNEIALGFDLASNPARLEALNLARDTGQPVATARITLVQEGGRQFAFLVFVPVFDNDSAIGSIEDRRANLRGFALGVFRIGDVVRASLENLDRSGVELRLYDDSAPEDARLLCVDRDGIQSAEQLPQTDNTGLMWTSSFELGARNWLLQIVPTPEFMAARRSWDTWMVLAGGLLFTGMLGAFLLTVTGTNNQLEREVSDRRQTEDALRDSRDELEHANAQLRENQAQLVQSEKMASIGQLAAGVAHEINNPVGFVTSNLGTLSDYISVFKTLLVELEVVGSGTRDQRTAALQHVEEIKQEEDLEYILSDVDQLLAESSEGMQRVREIVEGLKRFARVDESDLREADINEGIEATLKVVWNELKYRCDVKKDLKPLPTIPCYPGQLNQVFMNLLMNAVQAIPDHGEITIETEATDTEILIRISDTGIGICDEELPKVFDPFYTTKSVGKGTGLGLSISLGIVQKHEGKIEVESEVGKGTTFTVRLPIGGVTDEA